MNNIYSRGIYKYNNDKNYLKLIGRKLANTKVSNTLNSCAGILGIIGGLIFIF